jgi:hypothetical protein
MGFDRTGVLGFADLAAAAISSGLHDECDEMRRA